MLKITQTDVIVVIENALEIKNGKLDENSRAEDVDQWDSLGHLSILIALDKIFDGKIANITDMATANSLPKIFNILKQNSLL